MKSSGEESSTPSTTQRKDRRSVSPRKRAANRQNALKSTGPKTQRGKAISQRNSWKHGLFARQMLDFVTHGEDPFEYSDLLEGLRKQFQPCGRAEELEVERIAQSWWRLKRAYRYENAINKVAQLDLVKRELAEHEEHCKHLEERERAAVELLRKAQHEIVCPGPIPIPQELEQKVSALVPEYQERWRDWEKIAERESGTEPKLTEEQKSMETYVIAQIAIEEIDDCAKERSAFLKEFAVAKHVIPDSEALEKLLRYETTIERSLSRSLERLERMQRARGGEDGSRVPK